MNHWLLWISSSSLPFDGGGDGVVMVVACAVVVSFLTAEFLSRYREYPKTGFLPKTVN